jgi:UPF0755 protein
MMRMLFYMTPILWNIERFPDVWHGVLRLNPVYSGVFKNRLDDGMKLQSDPTVWYGTGENAALTTLKDLENNSKYNTYKYKGIPIGQISTVSKASVLAVLTPNKTKYV